MNKAPEEMQWGLKRAIPADAIAGWGARAIQEGDRMSLLPDRQDTFAVDEKARDKLCRALDEINEKRSLARAYARLWREGALRGNDCRRHVLIDRKTLKCVASTNASHGYVYVALWIPAKAS